MVSSNVDSNLKEKTALQSVDRLARLVILTVITGLFEVQLIFFVLRLTATSFNTK